jgi:glyceraldehyde-3-phosphate dehydrogenase (NAD(P))
VTELMRDLGRPRGDMWEVAVWEDALAADDREVYLTFQVHNDAIVVPETVDCIRALSGIERDGAASIARTDASMGIRKAFLPATARAVSHATGPDVPHSTLEEAARARDQAMKVGFKGAEEPADPEPTSAQRPRA